MTLSNKARRYIEKNRSRGASRLASDLKIDELTVREYLATLSAREPSGPTGSRKALFMAISLSIPVLFFILLELGLRLGNYRGNLDLFIYPTIFRGEYALPNPGFTGRYFFATTTNPTPSNDTFLTNKPANGFRIFVLGGSSAAGYPYGYNGTFSRVLRDMLQDVMPDYEVEVVNVATAAINTYTLYDQIGEILEHDPDAILIYSGHNEYYGALGVGSAERLGFNPGFVRLYLKLQRLRTFMLIRDAMARTAALFASEPDDPDRLRTLMERVVAERTIPLDSRLYELGKGQFESNLNAIIRKFNRNDIPVFIGSLTSNLKDHPPFQSVAAGDHPPADEVFSRAEEALASGRIEEATDLFRYARDLDALRFRAPSEFNEIIRDVTASTGNVYVAVDEAFGAESDDGIIGFNLMLEHLHPNRRGYFLMGITYYEAIRDMQFMGRSADESHLRPYEEYYDRMNMSEFDERVAWHRVQTLVNSWPFVEKPDPRGYPRNYRLQGLADSLAFQVVNSPLRWDEAKVMLGERYRIQGRTDEALIEYHGLIRDQPANDSPFVFAARIYLDRNDFDSAYPLLERAHELEESAYVTKMLGAIEVNAGNLDRGTALLERSLELAPNDAQALFNLSGAYGLQGRYAEAMEKARDVERLNPNFPGLRQWIAQLSAALNR